MEVRSLSSSTTSASATATRASADRALQTSACSCRRGKSCRSWDQADRARARSSNLMAGLDSPSGGRCPHRWQGSRGPVRRCQERSSPAPHRLRVPELQPLPELHGRRERCMRRLKFLGVRRAAAALSQVRIETAAQDRPPGELSGANSSGWRSHARSSPGRFLFADEPTGNLDSRTGQTVLDLLQTLNVERALTIARHPQHLRRDLWLPNDRDRRRDDQTRLRALRERDRKRAGKPR